MIAPDAVRRAALGLPATSERPAPRGGHPQFVANGKCFAELPSVAPTTLRAWNAGAWLEIDLDDATAPEVEATLIAAWRQRAKKLDVAVLDYAQGGKDLAGVFSELRTWPELTERGTGDFAAGGRAFLHFHHSETSRHADVKDGLRWGDPYDFPLGVPSAKVVDAFLAEVRRRLDRTLEAIATEAERARAARRSRAR